MSAEPGSDRDQLERAMAFAVMDDAAYSLNVLARAVTRLNAHYHVNLETGVPIPLTKERQGLLLALIHSEVSEVLEGVRKDSMDDKVPQRTSEEVELADVILRVLDYAGWRNLDLAGALIDKMHYNAHRKDHTHEARKAPGGKKF